MISLGTYKQSIMDKTLRLCQNSSEAFEKAAKMKCEALFEARKNENPLDVSQILPKRKVCVFSACFTKF